MLNVLNVTSTKCTLIGQICPFWKWNLGKTLQWKNKTHYRSAKFCHLWKLAWVNTGSNVWCVKAFSFVVSVVVLISGSAASSWLRSGNCLVGKETRSLILGPLNCCPHGLIFTIWMGSGLVLTDSCFLVVVWETTANWSIGDVSQCQSQKIRLCPKITPHLPFSAFSASEFWNLCTARRPPKMLTMDDSNQPE